MNVQEYLNDIMKFYYDKCAKSIPGALMFVLKDVKPS